LRNLKRRVTSLSCQKSGQSTKPLSRKNNQKYKLSKKRKGLSRLSSNLKSRKDSWPRRLKRSKSRQRFSSSNSLNRKRKTSLKR
jgi:hypothetical protein